MYSAKEFYTGESIFEKGDEGRSMFLIQEGEVEVLQEIDGIDRQIAVLERGDFFGEMAMLEAQPRSHSVRALADTKLVEVEASGFLHMLERNPEIAVRMIRKLGLRLARTEEMLFDTFAGTTDHPIVTDPHSSPEVELALVDLASGRRFPLPIQSDVTVGRRDPANDIHPDVDLTTIDPKLSTSRRHAKLLYREGSYFVAEEMATNGTFVNDLRVSPGQPKPIKPGDEARFGIVRMRFTEA